MAHEPTTTIYTWHHEPVPANLEVHQVHGLAFDAKGKVFLRIDNGIYKTTGGRPEPNESYEETLKREFLEEGSMSLKNIHYLGYQLADEQNDTKPYAQVRMIAQIDEIFENQPDPDNGKTYERVFVDGKDVAKLLGWGPVADAFVNDALVLAKKLQFI